MLRANQATHCAKTVTKLAKSAKYVRRRNDVLISEEEGLVLIQVAESHSMEPKVLLETK